jgi:hypothetical protein
MTRQTSRRGFLGLSALGLAAAVTPYESVRPVATVSEFENETSRVSPEISVWVRCWSRPTGTHQDDRTAPRKYGGLGSPEGKFSGHVGLEIVHPTNHESP